MTIVPGAVWKVETDLDEFTFFAEYDSWKVVVLAEDKQPHVDRHPVTVTFANASTGVAVSS